MFNKKPEFTSNLRGSDDRMPAAAIAREPSTRNGSPMRAIIDAGLCIKGDLETEGEVQVDGQVKGEIKCASLIVGKDGSVLGDVSAGEVVVRGKVKGTIRATRVILQDNADVEGDIFHHRIAIEEGARFLGASNHETGEATSQLAKLQQAAADMDAKAS